MLERTPIDNVVDRPPCYGHWTFIADRCAGCAITKRCRKETAVGTGVRILATPRHSDIKASDSRPDVEIDTLTALGVSPTVWPTLYTMLTSFGLVCAFKKSSSYRISFKDSEGHKVIIVRRMDARRVDVIARRVHAATALKLGWKPAAEERGRVSLVYAALDPAYENFFPLLRSLLTVSTVYRTFTP